MKKKAGLPDLMILFTNTVSHKMVVSALQEAKKNQIPVAGYTQAVLLPCTMFWKSMQERNE